MTNNNLFDLSFICLCVGCFQTRFTHPAHFYHTQLYFYHSKFSNEEASYSLWHLAMYQLNSQWLLWLIFSTLFTHVHAHTLTLKIEKNLKETIIRYFQLSGKVINLHIWLFIYLLLKSLSFIPHPWLNFPPSVFFFSVFE